MESDLTNGAQIEAPWLNVMACPKCSARLSGDVEKLTCAGCRQSWPVRNGVPQFLETARYWGEVPESDARRLIEDAERNGWEPAVLARFGDDRAMRLSLLDWQRASWVPLLGLDPGAVALDIGSGYGCITASLARGVHQVFSLEAVVERLELTRLRLSQERISNVQPVLASALEPPFAEAAFDLVVVNGVLEWVGEWEASGSPRQVQIKFLKKLARLLKPNGVLLIGIENRLSWDSMTGAIDHSGLPYTNLMPRRAATWWLRRQSNVRYRTQRNADREYRTYTYSEPGYRKLLGESGFPSSTFYWAHPGYNGPYQLVTTATHQVADQWNELSSGAGWRAAVKSFAARLGLLRYFVPEFVIVARKNEPQGPPPLWTKLRDSIAGLPAVPHPEFSLTTRPFGTKNVIRVLEAGGRTPSCVVINTTTAAADSELWFQLESDALRIVGGTLQGVAGARFTVPAVIGAARIGCFHYRAETPARGLPLAGIIFREGARTLAKEYVPRCLEAAVELARLLRHNTRVSELDPQWRQVPSDLTAIPGLREQIEAAVSSGETEGWVQHGNFTAGKIFLESGTACPTVVDWEHLFRGGSPLYDVFSLLVSILRLIPTKAARPDGGPGSTVARFEEGFFGSGVWADQFRSWLSLASEKLEVPNAAVWPMLLQFLVFRANALRERDAWWAGQHVKFLEAALPKKERFILLR